MKRYSVTIYIKKNLFSNKKEWTSGSIFDKSLDTKLSLKTINTIKYIYAIFLLFLFLLLKIDFFSHTIQSNHSFPSLHSSMVLPSSLFSKSTPLCLPLEKSRHPRQNQTQRQKPSHQSWTRWRLPGPRTLSHEVSRQTNEFMS